MIKYRREVEASADVFHPLNGSHDSPLAASLPHFFIYQPIPLSVRYSSPTQEAGNALIAESAMDMLTNANGTFSNHRNPNFDAFEGNQEAPVNIASVASFYDDAIIFVTGGTGFVFDIIRTQWPERLKKLVPVFGDISAPGLGVVNDLSDVTIIFHSAATVHFMEPFDKSVKTNVGGTVNILQLAKTMPKLKAFVHLSTAYSNAHRPFIQEIVYPPSLDPVIILKCTEMLPSEIVNFIGEKMQGEHPNTYTLTKSLAEYIVAKEKDLPVCILRPSIVTPALEEPFPGWVDNLNGITGKIKIKLPSMCKRASLPPESRLSLPPIDTSNRGGVTSALSTSWIRVEYLMEKE
ncbi:Putative fatty acyl-CoA reductase CG5065 [Eumeta japonica]|uniref:Fatty acyl-CoA reductase n=1 Tax=Eumeta variegata TaxID=151549 RepID=A0A4C1WBC8_EUMVA|nr:Putative fatty acyl-CoA reductase CG5065 [Eumeta japonica]